MFMFRGATERSRGDIILQGLCLCAGLIATFVLVEIGYQVINGAAPAISVAAEAGKGARAAQDPSVGAPAHRGADRRE